MLVFMIGGLLMTATVGTVLALSITGLLDIDGKKGIVFTVILAFAIGFSLIGLIYFQKTVDDENWNNGNCLQCGGQYELQSVTHTNTSGNQYYYVCKNCGYTIRLETLKNN